MYKTIHTVVFQAREGGGNPCPVTLEADGLTTEQMQAMTRDFGVESAFLMRPTRSDCHVRARYFVPLHEMEMCIHATVACATVLAEEMLVTDSPIVIETVLGPVQVSWERREDGIDVGVEQFLPKFQPRNPTREEICRVLRIPETALAEGPIQSAATSRFKLIVPLASREILNALEPDFEALWELCDQYETTGFYPFAREEQAEGTVFFARQFPKRAGYNEDPATGVAASALSAYLAQHQIVPIQAGWNSFTIFQGEAMGRPSVIGADVFVEAGRITRTRVRGRAQRTALPERV